MTTLFDPHDPKPPRGWDKFLVLLRRVLLAPKSEVDKIMGESRAKHPRSRENDPEQRKSGARNMLRKSGTNGKRQGPN